jgi:hypothetical protein
MGSVPTGPARRPSLRGELGRIEAERERDRREQRDPVQPPSILVYVQPHEPPASSPVGTLWLDTSVEA